MLGADLIFVMITLAEWSNRSSPSFLGWYRVFIFLTVATLTPAALLLAGGLRRLGWREQLGPIVAFLSLQWLLLLALALKLFQQAGAPLTEVLPFVLLIGIVPPAAYRLALWLLRRITESPEALFP